MATIADLVIKVDTTDLERANKALAEFNTVQAKAASSTEAAAKSQERTSRASRSQVDDINKHMASLVAQKKSIDSVAATQERAAQRQNAALQSTISSLSPIERGMANYAKQVKNLDAGLSTGALSQEKYNILLERAKQKLDALAGTKSFDPTADLAKQEAAFERFTASIDANSKIQTSYQNKLREADKYLASGRLTQEQYTESVERATAARDRALARTGAGITAQEREIRALRDLKNAIDPTNRELEKIISLERQLEAARKGGNTGVKLEQQEYEKLSRTLAATRADYNRRTADQDRLGLSAKQLKASLQGVPAQFTDIAVSLQGGQAPLTVFLQQGGQLKDMFGGIGPAARALGGYIIGLVNPLSVAAAALGVLAVGYYKGSQESDRFADSLIVSGNQIGKTASELGALTSSIAGEVGKTKSAVADVIAQLVEAGVVSGKTLESTATSIVRFSSLSGKAVSELAQNFKLIEEDPIQAAQKLQKEIGLLTGAIYEEITALVEQGRTTEAAELLTKRYNQTLNNTSDDLKANLGTIERGWNAVAVAAKGAWDAILDVGRNGDQKRLAQVNLDITNLEATAKSARTGGSAGGTDIAAFESQQRLKALEAERKALTAKIEKDKEDAQTKARNTITTNQQTKAQDQIKDAYNRTRTGSERLRGEIEALDKAFKALGDNPSERQNKRYLESRKRLLKEVADLEESEAKKARGPSGAIDNTEVNEIKNQVRLIKEVYQTKNSEIDAELAKGVISLSTATQKRKQLIEAEKNDTIESYSSQIAELERLKNSKGITSAQLISLDRQISDARANLAKAAEDSNQRLNKVQEDENKRIEKSKANIANYSANLQVQIENLRKSGERAVASLGRTANENALANDLGAQDDKYAEDVRVLNERLAKGEFESYEEYLKYYRERTEAHNEFTQTVLGNYEKQRAAESNWVTGAGAGFKQYIENGQNAADITKNAVVGAFNSMENALGTFVTTGKLDFRSLTISIVSDLAKAAAKVAASNILLGILGAATGGGTSGGFFASIFNSVKPQAKGGAWDSGVQKFAKGGAFTNSVVSRPTNFATSSGRLGLMGEAGPEAILPLTRTADGSLGVKAVIDAANMPSGSSGGGVAVVVNITDGGNQSQSTPGYEQFGKEIGNFVEQKYQQLITRDLRQGGQINRAIKG